MTKQDIINRTHYQVDQQIQTYLSDKVWYHVSEKVLVSVIYQVNEQLRTKVENQVNVNVRNHLYDQHFNES